MNPPSAPLRKTAFLDRDGTLIFEPPDTEQVDRLDLLRILPGVAEGLMILRDSGYRLVIVTNQDGMGTPAFPAVDFETVQNAFITELEKTGITFDAVFVCPHFKSEDCSCRKPKTLLVQDFLRDFPIDFKRSFVYGDRESDEVFARNLGLSFFPTPTNSFWSVPNPVFP